MDRSNILYNMRRRRAEAEQRADLAAGSKKIAEAFNGAWRELSIPGASDVLEVPVGVSPREALKAMLESRGFDVSNMPDKCDRPGCEFCTPREGGGFPAGYSDTTKH